MKKAFFVIGTDTGVGKTVVTSLLCREARRRGLAVGVMKPFASGSWEDSIALKKAAGSCQPLCKITPVFFKTPASPWAAALKEKKKIDMRALDAIYRHLRGAHDVLLVEGIGGLLVPVTRTFTLADLAQHWKIPVIVVARWGLGTLNHTLLTLSELKRRKIPVAGIIFNQNEPGEIGFVRRTNLEYFREGNFPPVLASVRYACSASARKLKWETNQLFGKSKSSFVKIEK